MKKRFAIFAAAFMMLLQGCGGVTQEEYDQLAAEKEKISKELDTAKADCEKAEADYEKAKTDYGELYQELIDEKAKKVETEVESSVPKAWATTYFGEDCIVLAENKEYLQIVSKEGYEVSLEGVQEVFNNCKNSLGGLAAFANEINYERIGIKFLKADRTALLEFVFKADNGSYTLESVSGDLQNSDVLNSFLNSMF